MKKWETLTWIRKGILEVLTNLTGNALDACTIGERPIQNPEIVMKSSRLPDEKILLEVRDNGIGNGSGNPTKII